MLNVFLKYSLSLLLLCPYIVSGQEQSKTFADVKKITEELKHINGVVYSYVLNAAYPNGQTDRLKGEVFVDNDKHLLYNSSDAETMVYSEKWFYKADHRKRSITIVNLDTEYKGADRKSMDDLIFKNGVVISFIDSVVMKHATIKSYVQDNDTVRIELTFPKTMFIRDIKMSYDREDKMFVSYSITTFRPMGQGTEGTLQKISCTGFRKPEDSKKYEPANFFSLKNGKIVVKKYNKYKLFTKP